MTSKQPFPASQQPCEFAVLTGDLVASSKLSPIELKAVMQRLREGAERFSRTFRSSVYGKLDVYSGDGWQLLMSDRRRSLRAALFLRAIVKSHAETKIDTRIAVAWGAVDPAALNPERISESTGEAFTQSGRALKDMKKRRRLIWHPGQALLRVMFLNSAVSLLDELAGRWSPRQAEAMALSLLDFTQEQIAAEMGTRQPTVQQTLYRAGWNGIEDFLKEMEYRF